MRRKEPSSKQAFAASKQHDGNDGGKKNERGDEPNAARQMPLRHSKHRRRSAKEIENTAAAKASRNASEHKRAPSSSTAPLRDTYRSEQKRDG